MIRVGVVAVVILVGTGARAEHRHPWPPAGNPMHCAALVSHLERDVTDAVIGAIDQPGKAAALSNLDAVVTQIEQRPPFTHVEAVDAVSCICTEFLSLKPPKATRWDSARKNFAAWAAKVAQVGGT